MQSKSVHFCPATHTGVKTQDNPVLDGTKQLTGTYYDLEQISG